MATLYFITGGTRSGKSAYASNWALELSDKPVYVATARRWDADFEKRIQRHQNDRDERWTNLEEEKFVSQLDLTERIIVVDCVTLWLTNFFVDFKNDVEKSLQAFQEEMDKLTQMDATFLIISNELGMGMHAETAVGRKFADLQGWANQYVAKKAEKVVLMVSGIPVQIKPK